MNHPFFQTPTSDAPYYPHQRPERLHDGATIVTRESDEVLKRSFEYSETAGDGCYPPSDQPPPKAARPSHAPLHAPPPPTHAQAPGASETISTMDNVPNRLPGHVFMSSGSGSNSSSAGNSGGSLSSSGGGSGNSNNATGTSGNSNLGGEDTESAARAMMMLVAPPLHSEGVVPTPHSHQRPHPHYDRGGEAAAAAAHFRAPPPAPVSVSSVAAPTALSGPPGIPSSSPAAVAADAAIPPMPPQWGSELDGLLDGVNLWDSSGRAAPPSRAHAVAQMAAAVEAATQAAHRAAFKAPFPPSVLQKHAASAIANRDCASLGEALSACGSQQLPFAAAFGAGDPAVLNRVRYDIGNLLLAAIAAANDQQRR